MQASFWTQLCLHFAYALRIKFKFKLNLDSSLNFKNNLLWCLAQRISRQESIQTGEWWLLIVLSKATEGNQQDGKIQKMQFDEGKSSGKFKVVAKMLSKVVAQDETCKGETSCLPCCRRAQEGETSPANLFLPSQERQISLKRKSLSGDCTC